MAAFGGSSIRKKRNFKGLQLNDSPLSIPTPSLTNAESSAGPSTLGLNANQAAGAASTSSGLTAPAAASGKGSSLNSGQTVAGNRRSLDDSVGTATGSAFSLPASGANYHNKLSEQLASLELGKVDGEKLDLRNEDLKFIGELGAGNGGTVTKVSSTVALTMELARAWTRADRTQLSPRCCTRRATR